MTGESVGNLGFLSAVGYKPGPHEHISVTEHHKYIRYILAATNTWYDEEWNMDFYLYMPSEYRDALEDELLVAKEQLKAAEDLHKIEGRRLDQKKLHEKLAECQIRLEALNLARHKKMYKPDDTKKSGFAAILAVLKNQYTTEIRNLTTSPSVFAREWMGAINTWRMYWVWTSWMMRQLGSYYANQPYLSNAGKAAATVQDAALFVSFALYFMRAAINLSLLVKHVFFPTKEEKEIPFMERVKAELDQRGWGLLNDIVWGIGNFITSPFLYYWFHETMSDFNSLAITGGLLGMDLLVSICRRISQQQKHEAVMVEFRETEAKFARELKVAKDNYEDACEKLSPLLDTKEQEQLDLFLHYRFGVNLDNVNEISSKEHLYSNEHRCNMKNLLKKQNDFQKILEKKMEKILEKKMESKELSEGDFQKSLDKKKKNDELSQEDIAYIAAYKDYLKRFKEREILLAQQERFHMRRRHYGVLWDYKRQDLNANIAFASSLVAALVIVSDFFVSKNLDWGISSAIGASEIMLVGPMCLYVFSLINNIYRGYLEISKTHALMKLIDEDLDSLGDAFGEHETDLDKIQRAQLREDKKYHQQMVNYHIINIVRKALVEVLLPAALIIGCGTLTMGWGFALMAGVALMSYVTRVIQDALIKPDRKLVKAEDLRGSLSFMPVERVKVPKDKANLPENDEESNLLLPDPNS